MNITERKGPWMIVNMRSRWGMDTIARGGKPTRVHATWQSAFDEAVRLANNTNHGEYCIFECVALVKSPKKKVAIPPAPSEKIPVRSTSAS